MTGKDLRTFRKTMKLNQTEFGKLLGFAFPQIRVSELERSMAVNKRVERLCELLRKKRELEKRAVRSSESLLS